MNSFFVSVLVLGSVVASYFFYERLNKNGKRLLNDLKVCSRLLKEFSLFDLTEKNEYLDRAINGTSILKPILKDYYENSFLSGATNDATPDIRSYLSLNELMLETGNRRLISAIPGIATAIGILFTFVGLYQGLSGGLMETTVDVSKIQSSISTVLSGMALAFVSSIIGMIVSICWTLYDKYNLGQLDCALTQFLSGYSNCMNMKRDDDFTSKMMLLQSQQLDSIKKLGVELGAHMTVAFTTSLNENFIPKLDKLYDANLELSQSIKAEQIKGLEKIVKHFVGEMNKALKDNFVDLGKSIELLIDWQKRNLSELEIHMSTFKTNSELQTDLLTKTTSMTEALYSAADNYEKAISGISDSIVMLDSFAESVQTNFGDISDYMKIIKSHNEMVERQLKGIEGVSQQLEKRMKEMNETLKTSEGTYKQVSTNMREELVNNLGTAFQLFDGSIGNMVSEFDQLFLNFQNHMKELPEIMTTMRVRIDEINNIIAKQNKN